MQKEGKAVITFSTGCLLRSSIRNNLNRWKFYKDIDDFTEKKGIISSVFRVRGDADCIKKLMNILDNYT